jgi:AcrR family transcriptional regulator
MKPRQPPPPPPSPAKDPTTRLLDATLEEIERHGLARLTVRSVAAAAGVNIAAVNYYFRSKDALVTAALKGSIDHVAEDTEPLLARMGEEPEDALAELLHYLFEGSLRFPQVAKAHLHEAFVEGEYGGPFPALFATILARTKAALLEAVPGLGEDEAGARVVAAFSAMFFPAFFAGFFAPIDPLKTPEERAAYAREAARRALAPVTTGAAPKKKAKAKEAKIRSL